MFLGLREMELRCSELTAVHIPKATYTPWPAYQSVSEAKDRVGWKLPTYASGGCSNSALRNDGRVAF